jgi:tetratricopeptide (TPR) repeat protein
MGLLCDVRIRLGHYAEAEPVARELVKQLRDQSPPANPAMIARSLHLLADILMNLDDARGAEPLLRESLELRQAALATDDPSIAITQGMLGECLTTLGQYKEAESLLLESYTRLAPRADKPSAEARKTNDRLVALYEAWGKPERAAVRRSLAAD